MPGEEPKLNDKGEPIVEKPEEKPPEKPEEQKVVTLTEEQYGALLDKVAELETIALQPKKETYTIDELTREVETEKEAKVVEVSPEDVDQMGNVQLANYIVDRVVDAGQQQIKTLDVKIESLKVLREIDKAEGAHEDFWEHQEAVHRIASANPTLSIEQAYNLAKLEKEGKGEGKELSPGDRGTVLHTLPPRTGIPSGEKPGVVSGATTKTETTTMKEATERAWDEVAEGKEK